MDLEMGDKKTIPVATDPAFPEDMSGYPDVFSNPIRLTFLKFIGHEPEGGR